MTRRGLIGRLLLLALAPVGLVSCVSRRLAGEASPPTGTTLGPASMLPPAERESLVALGEVLAEGRMLGTAERRYLFAHIDDRAERSPGSLALYRTAASTLDRLAGRPFAGLDVGERTELIVRHRLTASLGIDEDLGPFPAEMRALRMRVIPDLIRGYYASPAGWTVVGYDTFPGRCGDLTRYTRPES